MHVMAPGRVFFHFSPNLSWMLKETWGAWVYFAKSVCVGGGGGGDGLAQKKKSPDFRCPEVGISGVKHWSCET